MISQEIDLQASPIVETPVGEPEPWANPVGEGGILYFSPVSRFQRSPYRQDVLEYLSRAGIQPNTLIPAHYTEDLVDVTALDWNGQTDPWIHACEELGDVIRMWSQWSIADPETVASIGESRVAGDKDWEARVIAARLTSLDNHGLRDFWDASLYPSLVRLLVRTMDSRQVRGAVGNIVQTREDIQKKLIVGALEQDPGLPAPREQPTGELLELYHALKTYRTGELASSFRLVVSFVEEPIIRTDSVRYEGLSLYLQEALQSIARDLHVDIRCAALLGLAKQDLRIRIGKMARKQFTDDPHADTRAIAKVLTQLYLPRLAHTFLSFGNIEEKQTAFVGLISDDGADAA